MRWSSKRFKTHRKCSPKTECRIDKTDIFDITGFRFSSHFSTEETKNFPVDSMVKIKKSAAAGGHMRRLT